MSQEASDDIIFLHKVNVDPILKESKEHKNAYYRQYRKNQNEKIENKYTKLQSSIVRLTAENEKLKKKRVSLIKVRSEFINYCSKFKSSCRGEEEEKCSVTVSDQKVDEIARGPEIQKEVLSFPDFEISDSVMLIRLFLNS